MITLAQLKASDPTHPGIDLLTGRTPLFACQTDQRFSYCLYVPRDIDTSRPHPLVVSVHGTERAVESYRDGFADLADKHQCVVLAPLFPAGIGDPDDVHNYKTVDYRGIRFDLILLDMVAEVGARWPVTTDRFYLHGFSGGGQFAHRFLYLHPNRLAGISVAAPGSITGEGLHVPSTQRRLTNAGARDVACDLHLGQVPAMIRRSSLLDAAMKSRCVSGLSWQDSECAACLRAGSWTGLQRGPKAGPEPRPDLNHALADSGKMRFS
jgi:poly(3-hydroxybutyrate) depolymerase